MVAVIEPCPYHARSGPATAAMAPPGRSQRELTVSGLALPADDVLDAGRSAVTGMVVARSEAEVWTGLGTAWSAAAAAVGQHISPLVDEDARLPQAALASLPGNAERTSC